MLNSLVHTLNSVGKPTELFSSPDGSRVLVLPYGARALGLFSPHSEQNFFWTHPALEAVESARAFYTSSLWHNSGGDRTWLAPEVDFFLPNYPDVSFGGYWQPRQLDPGNYQIIREGDNSVLVNRLTVTSSRSKASADLEITKSIGPALNPLRYEAAWKDIADVEYAGFTLHTTLQLMESSANSPLQVGLWDLMQMPHGGSFWFRLTAGRRPSFILARLATGPHHQRSSHQVSDAGAGEHKLGFRAVDMTGRVGYMYPAGDQSALVVRNIAVNPSGEYVDVPWTETANLGFAGQTCNVNSALGSFSELEYHVPAIGKGTGSVRSHDVSQVWAFRGARARIQAIAKSLLSSGSVMPPALQLRRFSIGSLKNSGEHLFSFSHTASEEFKSDAGAFLKWPILFLELLP